MSGQNLECKIINDLFFFFDKIQIYIMYSRHLSAKHMKTRAQLYVSY